MPQQYFYAGGGDPYSAIAGQQQQWDNNERGDQRFIIQQMQAAEAAQRQMAAQQAQMDQARLDNQARYDFSAASEARQMAQKDRETALQLGLRGQDLARQQEQTQYDRQQNDWKKGQAENQNAFQERQFNAVREDRSFSRHEQQLKDATGMAAAGMLGEEDLAAFDALTDADKKIMLARSLQKRSELQQAYNFSEAAAEMQNRKMDYEKARPDFDKQDFHREWWNPARWVGSENDTVAFKQYLKTHPLAEQFSPEKIAESEARYRADVAKLGQIGNKLGALTRLDDYGSAAPAVPRLPWMTSRVTAPYREGTILNGPDGKKFVVRNGQPVPL